MAVDKPHFMRYELTVAASETTSNAIPILAWRSGTIQVPSAITSATFTFEVTNTESDGEPVAASFHGASKQDSSALGNITVDAYEVIPIHEDIFLGAEWLRIVTVGAEAAERVFKVTLKT